MNANNKPTTSDTTTIAATPARVAGDTTATRHETRSASRRLALTHTRHDDAISDVDAAVRDAVVATTRAHVALARRHRIRPAGLRWPRPNVATINDLTWICLAREVNRTFVVSRGGASRLAAHIDPPGNAKIVRRHG